MSEIRSVRLRRSPQEQIDTRAIEIAVAADAKAERAMDTSTKHFDLLRDDLKDMRAVRATQHLEAEAKFSSIQRAMWGSAVALIGLLAGWIFYFATHQH